MHRHLPADREARQGSLGFVGASVGLLKAEADVGPLVFLTDGLVGVLNFGCVMVAGVAIRVAAGMVRYVRLRNLPARGWPGLAGIRLLAAAYALVDQERPYPGKHQDEKTPAQQPNYWAYVFRQR